MRTWLARVVIAVALLLASGCGAGSAPTIAFGSSRVPAITGPASFDVIEIDQAAHRLYAADRTDDGVDVFDTSSKLATYLKTIALPSSPNGLAIAPDLGRLFVGMGGGSVAIVDTNPASPTADKVIQQVPTGGKTVDLMDYAPGIHALFASNSTQGSVARLDAVTGTVTGMFQVGHDLEQPRFNPVDGMLYVTSPGADALFEVDPNTGATRSTLKLSACYPRGLAINPKLDQAVIACQDSVIRQNLRDTADAEGWAQVGGGDIVTYDAAIDRFLVAVPGQTSGAGTVGFFGGNPIAYVKSVDTKTGGNSAVYDEANNLVYTPDTRPGKAGMASFQLPTGEVPFESLLPSIWPLAAGLAVIALMLLLVGRGADPKLRPAPEEASARRA